jgi:16S rRNA (guanine(966)-N(2))-methyltransferase RsmD
MAPSSTTCSPLVISSSMCFLQVILGSKGWDTLMRTKLRIVAGSLRGRNIICTVNANLRPTPQMVREALFSILGNAVPDRPFFDVFAGTGVVGMEAISRGASAVTFVERDFRLAEELEHHLRAFGVLGDARIARTDVYRWIERWAPPAEPVTVFLSPPFADFENRLEDLMRLVAELQDRMHPGSVLVLQAERDASLEGLPRRSEWDERHYGRNYLLIWVKELGPRTDTAEQP